MYSIGGNFANPQKTKLTGWERSSDLAHVPPDELPAAGRTEQRNWHDFQAPGQTGCTIERRFIDMSASSFRTRHG